MLRAALIREGSSDSGLGGVVERLGELSGVPITVVEPSFSTYNPPPGHDVSSQVDALLEGDDNFDLLVVHRDANGSGVAGRVRQIEESLKDVSLPIVTVVPSKETEAWLLLSESEIRRVAGKPSGTRKLDLPKRKQVESVSDPKGLLQTALVEASETSGARQKKVRKRFGNMRAQLLDGLDVSGPVSELSSFVRVREQLEGL